ncbi:MAG: hypothetical protein V4555_18560, partial [Acidobacteriota bacterium]
MPAAENIVLQYLTQMRALRATGATTAETSFYPAISALFNQVGANLKPVVIFTTQLTGDSHPDGGFFPVLKNSKTTGPILTQRPERGAVEIKPLGQSLVTLAQTSQVRGYIDEYGLVLLTNYHQFLLARLSASGSVETFDGYDLTKVKLIDRKALLQALLATFVTPSSAIQFSDGIGGD